MDLLDRLLGHDAWTTRQLLVRCADLTDDELDREFDIGLRSVRWTLAHIVRNMEVWADSIAEDGIREAGKTSVEALAARLDLAGADLARLARRTADRHGWDDTWVDTLDDPPTRKTYGAAIAHVITHSMHHRAQVIFMLRELGVEDVPEGDVFSWENQV